MIDSHIAYCLYSKKKAKNELIFALPKRKWTVWHACKLLIMRKYSNSQQNERRRRKIDHICLQITHFTSESPKFAFELNSAEEESFNFAATRSFLIGNLPICPSITQYRRRITCIGTEMHNTEEELLAFVLKRTVPKKNYLHESIYA